MLLAGGRSVRMGRDKAALDWNGVSLLQHMKALLARSGADPVWVGGGGYDLPDLMANAGPVSSLCALAAAVAAGGLPANWLITPVDMPLLTPGMLRRLLADGGQAAHFAGQPLPLRLRFDEAALAATAAIAARLKAGESVAIHALLDALETRALPATPDDAARLVGANSEAEFAALRKLQPELPSTE
ncbi:MAG: molybdenum cofactor guanylyltransferase [Sphingomonadales bacterium]